MTIVSIHTLTPLPVSALNRDDLGRPKTQPYGGVERLSLSSQAQKSAVRKAFGTPELADAARGTRTKRLDMLIFDALRERKFGDTADTADLYRAAVYTKSLLANKSATLLTRKAATQALAVADGTAASAKKKAKSDDGDAAPDTDSALMFLSHAEIATAIEYVWDAVLNVPDYGDPAEEEMTARIKKVTRKNLTQQVAASGASYDIALFGRMFANAHDLDVDAAVQVAPALGTGPVARVTDYFVARDDLEATSASAMMGVKEGASGVVYRYASVNLDRLTANLGGDTDLADACARLFVRSFIDTLPNGAQNGYAANVRPTFAAVTRTPGPLSLAPAFESPVTRSEDAAQALASYVTAFTGAYGAPWEQEDAAYLSLSGAVAGFGTQGTVDDLVSLAGVR